MSKEHELDLSVVILAGGRGERLGGDKASVVLGERALLQRQIDAALSAGCDDVLIVLRADQRLSLEGVRVTRDLDQYEGVLAGLAAGLASARHDWSLVVACDMPFVEKRLVCYMMSLREDWDVVIPRRPEGLEPLHALYHKRCLPPIIDSLRQGRRRAVSFLDQCRVRELAPEEADRIDPEGRSFFNVNTPADLAQARAWLLDSEAGLGPSAY
ncbi:MAG: molybdenum cofactor guanylyltransferase [Anaerolineae bacterium]